ncbi:MFS transporter [Brevibacillus dissolubilis]|uniref:MFS transporter n=1 Tax=Brevibacillus dissolubilis TaxID=1844116 RepID=UPI001116D476|nr:MFS transporter [Brevibacillus dissolubilis]
MNKYMPLFQNRSFAFLTIGQIISLLGSTIQRFALSLYVLGLTGSGTIFASVLAMSLIPSILLGPVAGVIADRFNRRTIMIVLDVLSAIVVGVMLLLSANDSLNMPAIYVSVMLLAIFTTVYQPTVRAMVPSLVPKEQLMEANALNTLITTTSNLSGPVLAGLIYSMMGMNVILLINGLSFLLAGILSMCIVIEFVKRQHSGNIFKTFASDLGQGFRFVRNDQLLWKTLLALLVVNLFLGPIFTVGIAYITKITLQVSDQMYGLCEGLVLAGSLMAPFLIGKFTKNMDRARIFFSIIGLSGIFLFLASASINPLFTGMFSSSIVPFWFFTACGFSIFAIGAVFNIVIGTMVQQNTPGELLGRVMSLVVTLATATAPLGQMIFGVLFDQFKHSSYLPVLISSIVIVSLSIYLRVSMAGVKEGEKAVAS